MPTYAIYVANLIAICVLTFAVYWPRHRRRDLVVAYLGVNVGVLAVASVLTTSTVGAGVGLGLFGVLSIIRLRSNELAQHEVAYYFSALALGLMGGLASADDTVAITLMAAIVLVMYLGDHPRLLRSYRHQTIVLDRAYPREDDLIERLEDLLGAKVHTATVQNLDLVDDTTSVDVRYEARPRSRNRTHVRGHGEDSSAEADASGTQSRAGEAELAQGSGIAGVR